MRKKMETRSIYQVGLMFHGFGGCSFGVYAWCPFGDAASIKPHCYYLGDYRSEELQVDELKQRVHVGTYMVYI